VLSVELFLLLFKLGASLGRLILQLSISQFTRFLEIISLLLDLFEFLVDLGSLTNWVLIFWPIWYSKFFILGNFFNNRGLVVNK
jgi:hypothetical protein